MKYNTGVAYLLWLLGGFGTLGLHRFYLGKIGTGVLWFISGGMCMAGSIYDLFTLAKQVEEANIKDKISKQIENTGSQYASSDFTQKENIEKIILKIARRNSGLISPGEVALESNYSVDQAREELEKMAARGMVEMLIRPSGVIVFKFPEFENNSDRDFIS